MRKILLSGAALGLFSIMAAPASAMPVARIAPAITADETAAVQVHYRRYYSRYSYRPRARYVYRNYDYDGGYAVPRSYGYYGGGPSYYSGGYGGGYGGGYYGGGPSIGFSFGGGRW